MAQRRVAQPGDEDAALQRPDQGGHPDGQVLVRPLLARLFSAAPRSHFSFARALTFALLAGSAQRLHVLRPDPLEHHVRPHALPGQPDPLWHERAGLGHAERDDRHAQEAQRGWIRHTQ